MWSSNRGANRQPCQNSPRPAYRGGVIAGVRRPHPGRCLNRDALFVLPLAPISFCSVSYRLDILDLEHAMSAASFRADARVIGLVATAHGVSHFFQLLLAPLFPWIRAELGLSYAELGALMAIFFIVSGVGQALSGFIVDRVGARSVLFVGLALLGAAALVMGTSSG